MIRELKVSEYKNILDLGRLTSEDFSLDKISINDKVMGYYIEQKLVGFISYSKTYETIDLLYIAVNENYQRQGIARALVNYLLSIQGINHIMLEVNEENTNAINFYNSLGFKVVRVIKNYYGDKNGYAMERKI